MPDLKTVAQKSVWTVLYLGALIPAGFAISYISNENLFPALIASTIFLSVLIFLVFKELRFLSLLAFASLILFTFIVLGLAGNPAGGEFTSRTDEKTYLLILPLHISFILAGSLYWVVAKTGFKRLIALFFIAISVVILLAFGNTPPAYYQNFIYTRVSILVLLALSIFLLLRKKRLWGILGVFSVVGVLILSAVMFSDKVYNLEETEQNQVLEATTPIANEMIDSYNRKDFDNFCNHCNLALKQILEENSIEKTWETQGSCTSFSNAKTATRRGGIYYVAYPARFQKENDQMYLVLLMEGTPDNLSVYGFTFAKE